MLKGIRIIGLTSVWAGPWAGGVLADMGAEVIKIETQQKIDSMRQIIPYAKDMPGVNRSGFNFINRGVKSCTINLKEAKGINLFKKLVKISDVVIENFPPRVLHGWGLDYPELRRIKPNIILVSLSGFGGTGPEKNYISYASVAEAVSGYTALFGYPGKEPALSSVYIADLVGGMYGVVSVVSALYFRNKTGKGLHIDLSQSEAMTSMIPESILDYVMNGRIRSRMGNQNEAMAPHGCYPCRGEDKWIAIAVATEKEWRALRNVMDNPEWSKNAKFSDPYSRHKNQNELNDLIAAWTKDFSHYELMHKLQDAGVAAGPSFNIEELLNDPHIKERDIFIEQNHPDAGKTLVYRSPWTSAGTKKNPPAPCLGEHNSYVFGELLGLSDSAIEKLIDQKVIF